MKPKKSHSNTISQHMGLVVNQAKKVHQCNKYVDFDELVQIGRISLWKIISKTNYNPNIGAFSTYASKVIYRAMIKYVNKEKKNIKFVPIADQIINGQHFYLWEYIPLNMTIQDILILQMRNEGYNLEEIGCKFGYSREWVGKKLNKIYRKLKEANEPTKKTKNLNG